MHVYYLFLVSCIVCCTGITVAANTINVCAFKSFSLIFPSTTIYLVPLQG
jgi:hypothetical protein